MTNGESLVNKFGAKSVCVEDGEECTLKVTWKDSTENIVSIYELVKNNDLFWRLRNPRYFKHAGVDPLGGLCWPEGEDISPGKIRNYIIEREV